MSEGENYSFLIRFANASISYLQYINKMIWPARLAMVYPHPGPSVSILYAIISAIFLLVVTIFIFRFAANRRYLVTGWFWYLGTLVPVIGLVQVGDQAMADRYSYITLTGLFIIIAWGLPELLEKWPPRKIMLWMSSLVVLFSLAVCAHLQQRYWKNNITLCQRAIEVTDNNYKAHLLMASALLEQGRIEESIRHNTETLRIKPNYTRGLNNLGVALYRAGRSDEAIYYYKRALEINPGFAPAYANLGYALAAKGKFDEAISLYNKALQIAPDFIDARLNLGFALASIGKFTEAMKEYGKILLVQPQNAVAHNDFGVALSQQGKFDEAVAHFNQAIRIDPNYTAAKSNLNLAIADKQKLQDKDTEGARK
jgi:tetratricopeptide (TPR) repeat protein